MRHLLFTGTLLTCLIATQVVFAQSFSDVEDTHYYYEAIEWMHEEGMVNGYDDGSFQAKDELNRVEALKMILSYAEVAAPLQGIEIEETDLPDVEEEDWYFSYVLEGINRGMVNGHEDGYFHPQDPVNRAQAMKMLQLIDPQEYESETSEDQSWYEPYMDFAEHNALLIPNENADFLPSANMTRGELAEAIYRYDQQQSLFTGEVEYGIASYYGESFNGRTTASGSVLDTSSMVAAHKTLPFGTRVRVTNTSNSRFVDVEIVDRGPFTPGRVIDLTPAAFEEIAWLSSGIANVRVEVLSEQESEE